jgi:hypothetical protein
VVQPVKVRCKQKKGYKFRIIDYDAGIDQAVEGGCLATVLVHTGHAIEECGLF